jgi:hypothetical protein
MVNFAELLNKRTEEAQRPKPYPVGTYICQIKSHKLQEAVGPNKTPACTFVVAPVQAGPDVDKVVLEEMGGIGTRDINLTYWVTGDALWRLSDFLTKLGMNTAGRTFLELLPETTGLVFQATVSLRPSNKQGDDTIYNDITEVSQIK